MDLIGRNAIENWALFDAAQPNDWWFHLEKFPSPHGYLHDVTINQVSIIDMARKIKEYSKFSNLHKVRVMYLQKKYLRKGSKPGEVLIVGPKSKIHYILI